MTFHCYMTFAPPHKQIFMSNIKPFQYQRKSKNMQRIRGQIRQILSGEVTQKFPEKNLRNCKQILMSHYEDGLERN